MKKAIFTATAFAVIFGVGSIKAKGSATRPKTVLPA